MKLYEKALENWKGRVEVMQQAHARKQRGHAMEQIPTELMDSPDENAVLSRIVDPDEIRIYKQNSQAIRAGRQGSNFAGTKRG